MLVTPAASSSFTLSFTPSGNIAAADFTPASIIPAGVDSYSFTIGAVDDATPEGAETGAVNLDISSAGTGYMHLAQIRTLL